MKKEGAVTEAAHLPRFQPASQQGLSRMENGLELLKTGSPSRQLESGTCEHPLGRWAWLNFALFVSKLFETRVTLETQLFIKCGQMSMALRSSILAQKCCGLSTRQEIMWFLEAERKACLFTGL